MSFSLTSAGSPSVPRVASAWLRAAAVPAVTVALDDITAARERAMLDFLGASGGAYSVHADSLLGHLRDLRDRLLGAAALVESYADRLTAHETVLGGIRARALACGLEVVGDTVLPPTGVLDSVTWSDLASAVLAEHRSLAAWVASELETAVPSYSDPDVARWVSDFLDDNRVGLAAAGLETTATRGSSALAARELLEASAHLDRFAKVPGPVSLAYDTVTALEDDEPSTELMGLVAGTAATTATVAAIALVAPAAPVLVVGGACLVVGGAAALGAKAAWERLPQPMQDSADDVISDAWDGAKDLAEDSWDWTDDALDDLGDSVLTWARP